MIQTENDVEPRSWKLSPMFQEAMPLMHAITQYTTVASSSRVLAPNVREIVFNPAVREALFYIERATLRRLSAGEEILLMDHLDFALAELPQIEDEVQACVLHTSLRELQIFFTRTLAGDFLAEEEEISTC